MSNTREKTLMLTTMGILTAIVIVLQAAVGAIKLGPLPFSITLVLMPIVVGGAMYGWKGGAWLGFVFGVIVLITDASLFLAVNVFGTVLVCILKGMLAGMAAAAVYRLLARISSWLAVIAAALVCPIVNTGVFLLGCMLFFYDTIAEWAAGAGIESVGTYMITFMVGGNFIIETVVNLLLSTAIVQVIRIVTKPAAHA